MRPSYGAHGVVGMAFKRLPDDILRPFFPTLAKGRDYEVTSQDVDSYNCVAWVMRDVSRWWEPGNPDAYWPRDTASDVGIDEYLWLFGSEGFIHCSSPALEKGVEKIAIYAFRDRFRHVAYQRVDGRWSSKLGMTFDVWHAEPGALRGGAITGDVVALMQRPRVDHPLANSEGLLLP
jgi:hypothetical protein